MTPAPRSRSRSARSAATSTPALRLVRPSARSIQARRGQTSTGPSARTEQTATAADRDRARIAAGILSDAIQRARHEGYEVSFAGRSGLRQHARQVVNAQPGARALGNLLVVAGRLWLPHGAAGASYLTITYDVLQRATASHAQPLAQAACAIYRALWHLASIKPERDQAGLAQCVISSVGSDDNGLHILPTFMMPGAAPCALDLLTVPANLAAFGSTALA